jgi:hypothetical protein
MGLGGQHLELFPGIFADYSTDHDVSHFHNMYDENHKIY